MSNLQFKDSFEDLRHWSGLADVLSSISYSSPTSVRPTSITSKYAFFGADSLAVRFYDTLESFGLTFSLDGNTIFTIQNDGSYYSVDENGEITTSSVLRSNSWHLIEVEVKENYRVSIDGTLIFTSDTASRMGFHVTLAGGIWDDFIVRRNYTSDFQGGTGTQDDLKPTNVELDDESVRFTLKPGYFYIDDVEYYHFGGMGRLDITPNASGSYTSPSGLFYQPGQPAFIVTQDDISETSGFVRTPLNRDYEIAWDQFETSGLYVPTITNANDPILVYETGTEHLVEMFLPNKNTTLVLSDEEGSPSVVRSESSYIDYGAIGDTYEAFAEVTNEFGTPVFGEVVTWKIINTNDVITDAGTSITDHNGIATISIEITEDASFHIFAQVNPLSTPLWVRVPKIIVVQSETSFQLDSDLIFDSQEARTAMGQNVFAEYWGTNPSESTGISDPSTHGQWEDQNPELRRPPIDENNAASEADGYWNGTDFDTTYPTIVAAVGDVTAFMNTKYVARKGYWGQIIISGANIRSGSPTLDPSQILNPSVDYEIVRDYGTTLGSYTDVRNAVGAYDSVFYVFYQPGSEYSGTSTDITGNWYFRGAAVYDEDLDQTLSQVQDIITDTEISS